MKTMKISTGILLIAVTSASLGMLTGTRNPDGTRGRAAIFSAYGTEQTSVEEWMKAPFESGLSEEAPNTEAGLLVEEWMTSPFVIGSAEAAPVTEAELLVEEWMKAPFENGQAEAELLVERWMTAPFMAVTALAESAGRVEPGPEQCTDTDIHVSFPFTIQPF